MSVRKISPEQMRNALFDIQRWWAGEEEGTSSRNIRAERWGRAAGNGGIPVNFAHVDDRKTAAWSAWGHRQRVEPRLGRIDNKHRKFNKWKLAGAPQFRYMGWQLTRNDKIRELFMWLRWRRRRFVVKKWWRGRRSRRWQEAERILTCSLRW